MYISFDPEADEELYEAAGYFEERSRDGARFLADVGRTTGLLFQFPNVGTPVRGRFRRILLKTFPYQLVYRVDGKEIRIFAVAHLKRRPGYWRKRLP
jgi:plasmid stabilization system protein ParE